MIQAVVFDVFGTLLQIGERRHPFRQLMQNLRLQGKTPRPDDARTLMTRNLGLAGAADYFGAQLSNSELASLESDLFTELPCRQPKRIVFLAQLVGTDLQQIMIRCFLPHVIVVQRGKGKGSNKNAHSNSHLDQKFLGDSISAST